MASLASNNHYREGLADYTIEKHLYVGWRYTSIAISDLQPIRKFLATEV